MGALVQLVKHFGWTWVGVVAGDDAYGRGGAAIFANEVLMRTNGRLHALLNMVRELEIRIDGVCPVWGR